MSSLSYTPRRTRKGTMYDKPGVTQEQITSGKSIYTY